MLYHFFRDVTGESKKIATTFKKLQEALGIRRSIRERARRVLEGVSEALPPTGRAVTTVAGGLLGELEAARTVQKCFETLMEWLEKENRTVFFFIDDIDRATGDQIRDLLSELKLYVSHRRIVAVLGYDENYVGSALKSPVLPPGIDPKKYLEKIVTVKRNVPTPEYEDLRVYATHLLRSVLDLPRYGDQLGRLAVMLSSNPRRLKNLVLMFTQFLSAKRGDPELKKLSYYDLASLLITSTAANMGFFADDKIKIAIESGEEDGIVSAIQEFVKKDSSKSKDAEVLINAVRYIEPGFRGGSLWYLRLRAGPVASGADERRGASQLEKFETFDWSTSFIPIFSIAAMRGFKIPSEAVAFPSEIIIPPSTKTQSFGVRYKKLPSEFARIPKRFYRDGCLLSWNQSDMLVLVSSMTYAKQQETRSLADLRRRVRLYVDIFFRECTYFVAEKRFVLWLIDDLNSLDEETKKILNTKAQEISKGLKNAFIFQYTPSSKVKFLLEFLLNVVSKQS